MADDGTNGRVTWTAVKLAMGIVIPLLAVAVTWGAMTSRIATLDERQRDLEEQIDSYDQTLLEIQVCLAEIKKDILYIREQVDERKESDVERDQLAGDTGSPGERSWASDYRLPLGALVQAVP